MQHFTLEGPELPEALAEQHDQATSLSHLFTSRLLPAGLDIILLDDFKGFTEEARTSAKGLYVNTAHPYLNGHSIKNRVQALATRGITTTRAVVLPTHHTYGDLIHEIMHDVFALLKRSHHHQLDQAVQDFSFNEKVGIRNGWNPYPYGLGDVYVHYGRKDRESLIDEAIAYRFGNLADGKPTPIIPANILAVMERAGYRMTHPINRWASINLAPEQQQGVARAAKTE